MIKLAISMLLTATCALTSMHIVAANADGSPDEYERLSELGMDTVFSRDHFYNVLSEEERNSAREMFSPYVMSDEYKAELEEAERVAAANINNPDPAVLRFQQMSGDEFMQDIGESEEVWHNESTCGGDGCDD